MRWCNAPFSEADTSYNILLRFKMRRLVQRCTVPKHVSLLQYRFAQKNCMMTSVLGTTGNSVPPSAQVNFFCSRVRLEQNNIIGGAELTRTNTFRWFGKPELISYVRIR